MLNAVPSKNVASDYFSPCEIMTNTKLDYIKHCKVPFGTYCQVFQHNDPSNTDAECTVDAICLGPTGNLQGSYKFFNLETRQKIICNQFTPIPMTKAIITRVNRIAEHEGIPEQLVWIAGNGKIIEEAQNDPQAAGVANINTLPPQQLHIPPPLQITPILLPGLANNGNDEGQVGDADESFHGSMHTGVGSNNIGLIGGDIPGVPAGVAMEANNDEMNMSDLEDSLDSSFYPDSNISTGIESYNNEVESEEEYVPEGDADGSESGYQPSNSSINQLVNELEEGLNNNRNNHTPR